MTPFHILALPRCRTNWLAVVIGMIAEPIQHDSILFADDYTLSSVETWLVDVPAGRKVVIIDRDPIDVAESYKKAFNVDAPIEDNLIATHRKMMQLNYPKVAFNDLSDSGLVKAMIEYLIDDEVPLTFIEQMQNIVVTQKMSHYMNKHPCMVV